MAISRVDVACPVGPIGVGLELEQTQAERGQQAAGRTEHPARERGHRHADQGRVLEGVGGRGLRGPGRRVQFLRPAGPATPAPTAAAARPAISAAYWVCQSSRPITIIDRYGRSMIEPTPNVVITWLGRTSPTSALLLTTVMPGPPRGRRPSRRPDGGRPGLTSRSARPLAAS